MRANLRGGDRFSSASPGFSLAGRADPPAFLSAARAISSPPIDDARQDQGCARGRPGPVSNPEPVGVPAPGRPSRAGSPRRRLARAIAARITAARPLFCAIRDRDGDPGRRVGPPRRPAEDQGRHEGGGAVIDPINLRASEWRSRTGVPDRPAGRTRPRRARRPTRAGPRSRGGWDSVHGASSCRIRSPLTPALSTRTGRGGKTRHPGSPSPRPRGEG